MEIAGPFITWHKVRPGLAEYFPSFYTGVTLEECEYDGAPLGFEENYTLFQRRPIPVNQSHICSLSLCLPQEPSDPQKRKRLIRPSSPSHPF